MQCKQAHEYAHIKCNQSKFMSLLPLLVCFSCPRILIHLFSSMLLPLYPRPTSISFVSHLFHCIISPPFNQAFISLYNLSPFVINFHKRCASHLCKGSHWGRWLRLESCIFYGHHLIVGMTPLVDTTCNLCRASWDTTHKIFDLVINLCDTSPYVIAWVIHLIHLSSCRWGMHSSFDDHLKLRITCGTSVLHDWYHV